jgi:hypothetical protein
VTSQRSVQHLKVIALLLALVTLAAMILRMTGRRAPAVSPPDTATPYVTTQSGGSVEVELMPSLLPVLPTGEGTLSLPDNGPASPADPWANAVLDVALPALSASLPDARGLAWWQGSSAIGTLELSGEATTLNDQPVGSSTLTSLMVLIPKNDNPNYLTPIASMERQNGVLTLSVDGSENMQWVLSNATTNMALRALAVQADRRNTILLAAYSEGMGVEGQLVLVSAEDRDVAEAASATAHASALTPSPSSQPTPMRTPTPTRTPEAYLGRVIDEKMDPVIDDAGSFDPTAIARYLDQHPWIGLLTWTETGAEIDGRKTALSLAEDVTFYTLSPNDPSGSTHRFMQVTYDGVVTRLPDDQIMFQGQRLEEMLYWMVRRAAERGGQLVVAYDDFGSKQAVTIVAFRPFPSP